MIPSPLRRSPAFRDDFRQLLGLSTDQLRKVAVLGNTEHGFDVPDELIKSASESMSLDQTALATAMKVADFLYDHARAAEMETDEATQQVCEFAGMVGVEGCDSKASAIRLIFEPKEAYDLRDVIHGSNVAVVPILAGVESVCDMRATVDRRTRDVVGYLPIALVGFLLRDTSGDIRTVDMQLDEGDIDKVLEELDRIKSTLATLRKEFGDRVLNVQQDDG